MHPGPLTFAFADSELSHAVLAGADLVLTFAAAAVDDAAGVHGYLCPLVMVFPAAQCTGDLARCTGKVDGGSLSCAGVPLGRLPLPFATTTAVDAHLQFANGATLAIGAAGLQCRPTGEGRFVESYAC